MTSDASSAPGSRRAPRSTLQRHCLTVLVVGTVLALAAALGPAWLTRVGVVLAVATGVVACRYAWREVADNRRSHAAQMLAASRSHGRALSEERKHNASVVDVLTSRADAAQQEVERQRGTVNGMRVEISTLRTEVSTLRRENTALIGQLAQRNRTVGSLQRTVRAREEELAALRRDGASAEVHGMPRRVLSSDDATAVAGIVDRRTLDTAMVLPNYEMDRQLA